MKTKLYALTGFLGSGKTTFLKTMLTNLEGKKVGVIQNEFGKLGIDGEILRNDDIKMVEINRGSIFCSCLKLSFVEALVEMGKMDLEYLFVESSGLADPSNMEEILAAVAVMAGDAFEFEGAVCLVDAMNFEEQLKDSETTLRQLKHCNIAVVTKLDLKEEGYFSVLQEEIRKINPVCKIITADNGKVDFDVLGEDLTLYKWAECEETTNSVENKPKTLFLNYDKSIDGKLFQAFLDEIKGSCYRIKGFFQIDGEWKQVDVVGKKIDYSACNPKNESQIVIISSVGNKIIKIIFDTWEKIMGEKPQLKN